MGTGGVGHGGTGVGVPCTPDPRCAQREPSVDLLEAFTEHWKGITGYYLEATGEWGAGRGSLCPGVGWE